MARIVAFLSQSKTANILAGLIIFFSATQLGLHFWPLTSLVYGVRVDYLAPTLYFLDLLIIGYLTLVRPHLAPNFYFLVPIFLANLLYSQNPLSTLSWSLHLVLYLLFIFSLPKFYISNLISTTLTLSLIFQLALSLAQVFLGHSVGGLLYYVGERSVSVGSPNIALATFMGDVVLRAYGTFSHPNILAGWSVVVLLIIFTLRKKLSIFPLFLVALILLLTQSRSALISLFGLVIPLSLLSSLRSRLLYFFFFLIPILYFLFPNFLSRSDLSISERIDLQAVSLRSISHYPLFGTGAEASISTYPSVSPMTRLLQPDHNSVTLFLSWFGAFGVLALLFHFRVILIPIFYHLLPIFPLILLDHYLLTSPQGLFSLIFYLFISRPSDNQVH